MSAFALFRDDFPELIAALQAGTDAQDAPADIIRQYLGASPGQMIPARQDEQITPQARALIQGMVDDLRAILDKLAVTNRNPDGLDAFQPAADMALIKAARTRFLNHMQALAIQGGERDTNSWAWAHETGRQVLEEALLRLHVHAIAHMHGVTPTQSGLQLADYLLRGRATSMQAWGALRDRRPSLLEVQDRQPEIEATWGRRLHQNFIWQAPEEHAELRRSVRGTLDPSFWQPVADAYNLNLTPWLRRLVSPAYHEAPEPGQPVQQSGAPARVAKTFPTTPAEEPTASFTVVPDDGKRTTLNAWLVYFTALHYGGNARPELQGRAGADMFEALLTAASRRALGGKARPQDIMRAYLGLKEYSEREQLLSTDLKQAWERLGFDYANAQSRARDGEIPVPIPLTKSVQAAPKALAMALFEAARTGQPLGALVALALDTPAQLVAGPEERKYLTAAAVAGARRFAVEYSSQENVTLNALAQQPDMRPELIQQRRAIQRAEQELRACGPEVPPDALLEVFRRALAEDGLTQYDIEGLTGGVASPDERGWIGHEAVARVLTHRLLVRLMADLASHGTVTLEALQEPHTRAMHLQALRWDRARTAAPRRRAANGEDIEVLIADALARWQEQRLTLPGNQDRWKDPWASHAPQPPRDAGRPPLPLGPSAPRRF